MFSRRVSLFCCAVLASEKMIIGSKLTPRAEKLKAAFLAQRPAMCCTRAAIYTEAYQKYEGMPVVLKKARALKETLAAMPIFIEDGELIVGHPASQLCAAEVFPDFNMRFMEDIEEFGTREYNRLHAAPEVKKTLYELWPYWQGKTLPDLFRHLRPEPLLESVKSGLTSNTHEWGGFGHVAMDYRKILDCGIGGMQEKIAEHKRRLRVTDPEYAAKSSFYAACEEACEGTLLLARRYRALALKAAGDEEDPARSAELRGIAELLQQVPENPARNFRQAVQSLWFMQLIPQIESNSYSFSPGRFDQYMWPYLEKDLAEGAITMEEAQELVDLLFLKFCEILRVDSSSAAEINAGYASGQNVTVGGIGADGKDKTNALSYLCLAANYRVGMHQPNFTVRLHKDTPEEFLAKVVESISCGNGMPQLLNDDLIVPALVKRGIPEEEAREYIPVGCDEITVHRHWGRCNGGYLNFAKVLEMTLGEGTDVLYQNEIGRPLQVDGCASFEDFMAVFEKQLAYGVELQACDANLADHIHRHITPLPFVSLFMDDCLQRGRDVTDGGAHYNTTALVGVGTATCADSLHALKSLVFDQKKYSLAEFRSMLAENFAGAEASRQYIINRLPKFGNDKDEVDKLAVRITNCFFDNVEKHTNYRGGAFWPALYSVSAQIGLGNHTAATADGRLMKEPISDGLTPMYGADTSGPTALLKSVAKVDQGRALGGVIINQRLTQSLFDSQHGREKMASLLRFFVEKGSFHWQFNIVDNETLRKAQENPDDYRSLVVRVAGYSAIFVELSLKAQNSIIARHGGSL